MSVILVYTFLCYLLVVTAAARSESADQIVVDAVQVQDPLNTYRIEIFNTLSDNIRATCYNTWSKTSTKLVAPHGSYNVTFHLPWAWCCDFSWYVRDDPRLFFQSFLVSDGRGLISDHPAIACGKRCTWRVDAKGFSIWYNGDYHRLYEWIMAGVSTVSSIQQAHETIEARVYYDLTCNPPPTINHNNFTSLGRNINVTEY